MNLEHFALLVEIQGLDKKIGQHLKNIATQEERVNSLNKQRELKEKNLLFLEKEIQILKNTQSLKEKELFEKEQLIDRSIQRQKTATNEAQCKAIENELALFRPQKEKLEVDIYSLMEKIENFQNELKDHQQFLLGSLKALQEVKLEVNSSLQTEKKQMSILEERIELSLQDSPPSVRNLWQDLHKKFPFNSPLSFIENGTCSECRCSIARNFEALIEKGGVVEFCPHCKRLLTPRKRV